MLRRLVINKKVLVIVPVVLALVLAGLFLPAREVSIEPYGVLSLESKITISIGYEVAYASPSWVSPTGFVDGVWTDEPLAYDENTETYAYGAVPKGDWSGYIEFSIDAINCNKVRAWVNEGIINVSNWEVDVYYSGAWNNIFTGSEPLYEQYVEFPIGSTESVTGMRLRTYSTKADSAGALVYEVDFDEVAAVPDISNLPISKDFGTVMISTDYWSNGSAPNWGDGLDDTECYFTVTNNSGAAVDIAIRSTNFSGGIASGGWDLGDPAFADTVRLRAGKSGDASEGDMFVLTTSDQPNFISGLLGLPSAPNNTKKWELKMETPTSFSNGDVKTATITLTATFS